MKTRGWMTCLKNETFAPHQHTPKLHIPIDPFPSNTMIHCEVKGLGNLALGLNIEGDRPARYLPRGCAWYNFIVAVDAPLRGVTFDEVMCNKATLGCDLIEEAAGIDPRTYVDDVVSIVNAVQRRHSRLLVHIHQFVGTTTLDSIVRDRCPGLHEVITDVTHFFAHPVNYAKDYPDVDAVLSLSQCAALSEELKVGQWWTPTEVHAFDPDTSVVCLGPAHHPATTTTTTRTQCNPRVDELWAHGGRMAGRVAKGALLMVDDLWNPTPEDMKRDVLVLDSDAQYVLQFVKKVTTCFDDSHDWRHAVEVAKLATRIRPTQDVLRLALLHDVCDHKYPDALPREELSKWIRLNLPAFAHLDALIDQVSFSKQVKARKESGAGVSGGSGAGVSTGASDGKGETGSWIHQETLEAVRDADRLEALGVVGVRRCLKFICAHNGTDAQLLPRFIQHAHEKLLRLMPEKFIVTPVGRQEGAKRHKVVQDFVDLVSPVFSACPTCPASR